MRPVGLVNVPDAPVLSREEPPLDPTHDLLKPPPPPPNPPNPRHPSKP